MVRNVADIVNSDKLHPPYFHGIRLLQEVLLYLTQIKKKKITFLAANLAFRNLVFPDLFFLTLILTQL